MKYFCILHFFELLYLFISDVYGIEDIEFHVGDNDDTGIKHRGSEHLVDSTR